MSSSNRTTSKGGKAKSGDSNKSHNKHDKSDTGKASGDKQQQHGSGISNDSNRTKSDDPGIKDKVKQIMEMTCRSEEEVCLALHECDNDTERAVNMLYENGIEGTWETSSKKKKNRQASTSKTEADETAPVDEWNENPGQSNDKEKPRNKSGGAGGPPRLHGRHNDSRGWRGRENKENERNLDDVGQHDRRDRRGRPAGHSRGGGSGGRGRGGGRAGSRYPPRNNNRGNFSNTRTIDTWDNATTWETTTITNSSHANTFTAEENWDEFPQADDWSTEEYTGSLADTKVFTPSMNVAPIMEMGSEAAKQEPTVASLVMENLPTGSLSPAQAQYLNQFTNQQSNESLKPQQYSNTHMPQTYGNATSQTYNSGQAYVNNNTVATQQYNVNAQSYSTSVANTYSNSGTNYPVSNSYAGTTETVSHATHPPTRPKTQRARVPPPSKIPSSAVEMPGDLNSSIGFLDVQFGVMDFLSDSATFDSDSAKFNTGDEGNSNVSNQTASSNLDLNQTNQSTINSYTSTKSNNTQSSITSALSQSLNNTDNIPQTSDLSSTYNAATRNATVSATTNAAASGATPSALELNKQPDTHSYSQASSYNAYTTKTSTYQSQSFSSNYNSAQAAPNNYNASSTQSYNAVPNAVSSTYQNSYSGNSSYQTNSTAGAFPTITQSSNSYPSNTNQYHQQASQSVYGANTTGLSNASNYVTPSSNQYGSYNTGNKLKESSYESSATPVVSSAATTMSAANTSALTQTTTTVTKSTTAALAKSTNNVISNIPPAGIPPVMSTQYIMSQVPYFQQPIYSFEDMQLLAQQRISHVPGYYDVTYPTPTTLAPVRDGPLQNVAYSISDGRFTRGDNNTSPVPSTLSQQTNTQGHQAQPMLAAQTGATPFFYAPYNPLQTYQFGAVYPQLPPVTNTHGTTNSQYPKPGTYGSAYGSAYDPLSQSQDYGKAGYVGNTQGQSKGTGGNTTSGSAGNDLNAIYGKSHTALGKVNSYEKQGFHSGTPPPFTGPNHGIQNTALAPSGTSYGAQMFIPTLPPHGQHHSTPLMHQQLHQMEVRHQGRRGDSNNSTGQRSQTSSQTKTGAKQGYPNSYWNQS